MSTDPLSSGLERVRQRFLETLRDRFNRVVRLRAKVAEEVDVQDSLCEIGKICHKIAGTAATLGFPDLGSNAAEIDDLIMSNQDELKNPDPYLLMKIDEFVTATRDTI
ncbi:Hpt domain-containing protein [Roseovarius sp. S1116L3]|uniref:Hpt domain-containing protein n=1 Tax=Roseovarius roseus TaxID=3342636 RepID=UPI0037289959